MRIDKVSQVSSDSTSDGTSDGTNDSTSVGGYGGRVVRELIGLVWFGLAPGI